MWVPLVCLAAAFVAADVAGAGAARLVCYVENSASGGFSECTHLVYAGDARGDKLDGILKEYRKNNPRLKIVLRVGEADKELSALLKSKHVQGLEIHDAHKSVNRTKITETVEAARSAISAAGGGPLFLALPAHSELLAKYYDLRALVKKVDLMMVQTHALGLVPKTTYHPSRLSGLWDMMNTDSVVDLAVGLGVPASKVVIVLPATALKFTLQNETLSTPGSPAEEDAPKEIDQAELCRLLQRGRWTLERDQDLSAPYAFKDKTWISFEDSSSVDVKGKYARVRGLAGLALHKAERDTETPCGSSLKTALAKVLNQQSRAPRAAVLRSLEHEILSAPGGARALDALQVSPYRITQVVDSDGVIHSIREDTRTEFTCSRQGYFVHPRSCARFYRCVKFDQLSPEYTVFEFDCPAGLAFDSRYEVCVWPGSLPHSQACPGSSEIAPVPQTRFVCPEHEGYYADPENCRWFFACLDHGKAPLTAYEFRCPFGLGFDAERLTCDWPWLVPACGNIARYEAEAHGFSAAYLTGAAGFQGQTADAINVAAHQSLVSGASLNNLVGIQNGFLSKDDALDSNYIASQELANGAYSIGHSSGISHDISQGFDGKELAYQLNLDNTHTNPSFVQPTNYNDEGKYTSGSIILDDYRLPSKSQSGHKTVHNFARAQNKISGQDNNAYRQLFSSSLKSEQYEGGYNYDDNSGAYVHDPSGDSAEPYRHIDSPVEPYLHADSGYKQSSEYNDYNKYEGYSQNNQKYQDNSGQYVHDNSGGYIDHSTIGAYKDYSGSYNADYSGAYSQTDSGKYIAGVYRTDGHIGGYSSGVTSSGEATGNDEISSKRYQGIYSASNAGNYLSDSKAYTGASHTLTAGAVNVGLVGKTTLVDAGYTDQANANYQSFSGSSQQTLHPGHVSVISQPAVSIHHLGTDGNNLDGYHFVTTPTSSGIPTTATPFAFTTALPTITYKTTFVPEQPKTSIKQIFGYTAPALTYVKPAIVPIKQEYVTPKVEVTDYNEGINSQASFTKAHSSLSAEQSSGYQYTKPAIKFEDGITYTTAAPVLSVSTNKPQGFSHSQQTLHKIETGGFDYSTASPVNEPAFKKLVAYTTGPSVNTYVPHVPSTVASIPQSFSHQTVHKVETGNIYNPSIQFDFAENDYSKSDYASFVDQKQGFNQFTSGPAVVSSTYEPQVFSQQTVHEVDVGKLNTYSQNSGSGYAYKKSDAAGYKYEVPEIKFEDAPRPTVYKYSTPAPIESSYRPHAYSHQTIHKTESQQYVPISSTLKPNVEITYQQPTVSTYENPILKYTQKVTPVTYVEEKYTPQSYSHQTIHKTPENKVYRPSIAIDASAYQSSISHQAPKVVTHYTTAQPTIDVQPVISTYQPQVLSHQTLHKVEASKVKTYSQGEIGYEYQKPAIQYVEEPKTVIPYTTPTPVTVSTYQPHAYSHQTVHQYESQKFIPVSSTPLPKVELTYQKPSVSIYENPLLKYTQKETYLPPTATVYTETYKPILQQHAITHINQPVEYKSSPQQSYSYQNIQLGQEGFSYSQPEIQRNDEISNVRKSYSDASLVSHQVYHQINAKPQKDVVFVSSTPATLAYEEHYEEYESPKKQYKAPEYIPPITNYQQSYTVSTEFTPVVDQIKINHNTFEENKFANAEYSQQYDNIPIQEISFSTSHSVQPKKEYVPYQSSFPSTTFVKEQVVQEVPEIQISYKSNEYLPPVSTVPIVTSTYKPDLISREYLPPSTTARPYVKSTTSGPAPTYPEYTTQYKAPDYLPPVEDKNSKVVHFESFGLKNNFNNFNTEYTDNQHQKILEPTVISSTFAPSYRKQNIVVETAKSNLLGFGTVGPDAGLVSPTTYTTLAPVVSSTYRPIVSSSTTPVYVQSTTQYKAPEYLPPLGDTENDNFGIKINNPYKPVQRKQNIVVETAKSRVLGYGTVGSDAGLVYSTQGPRIVDTSKSYSRGYQKVTTPIFNDEIVEVTPSSIPTIRAKPKVAVVTKINDFNPLLVRKLGAVCSCQSPVLILRGKRPNVSVERDFDDYSNDYEDAGRGDIGNQEWTRKSAKLRIPSVTATPVVSSTFNPIIVPDDSYYQDLQEENNYESVSLKGREIYSENFVSSTPVAVSTTEKVIKIRPRGKSVTIAPTYKTVLLNQEVAPEVVAKQPSASVVDSQAFDRYGPGGWRSRDETLQGSVDCQRAGLFRHPKQCNKFYACRWDSTKQRFTLHVFNCPVHLSFDESLGACNWPSQGPACQGDTLLTNAL